jgi:hypothetical protein
MDGTVIDAKGAPYSQDEEGFFVNIPIEPRGRTCQKLPCMKVSHVAELTD